MPRQARLDIPGTLHHVIIRCTEKQKIVKDRSDRQRFLKQIGDIAVESKTVIYAWAILPNQVHILLRSGPEGLAPYMRRLLTSHAVAYNRRHRRHGSLFQERYKSTVCEEKLFFRQLVCYIHLRPLKERIVRTITELNKHPWCGHAAVLGDADYAWHDRAYVLQWFGKRPAEAKKAYRSFLREGAKGDDWPEFTGGGLLRSVGGWDEVKALRKKKRRMVSDARILGSNAFVKKILKRAQKSGRPRIKGAQLRRKIETTIRQTCKKAGVTVAELQAGSRRGIIPAIRLQLAQRLTKEMDVTLVDASRHLGVTPSALSKALTRSRKAS
jgi:REP element-mobilizing transposase RayT/transposase-like protein